MMHQTVIDHRQYKTKKVSFSGIHLLHMVSTVFSKVNIHLFYKNLNKVIWMHKQYLTIGKAYVIVKCSLENREK